MGEIDSATWYLFGFLLTGGGLALSYLRYRKHGVVAGVRAVGWSLLPLALALTGVLRLAGQIAGDVGTWATRLVFSPTVWLGISLAGVSVVLLGVSGWLAARGKGGTPRAEVTADASAPAATPPKPAGKRGTPPPDDDMADIEAILRKHGIQ